MNSATDNPLIDAENQVSYHCGNFLGQYVGMAMDHLRYYLGLLAKHLDVQIALLVVPEFNNGLPPSLVGNRTRKVNMGLKGLQLASHSIMLLLTFFGNSLADRFPTHAEQFNQNINSQGFGSANLARQAVEIFQQYLAIGLMFGVQAVDLRTYVVVGHYDARACLSPATARLYDAVREVVGRPPSATLPYIWNDNEQPLDAHIVRIAASKASACLKARTLAGVGSAAIKAARISGKCSPNHTANPSPNPCTSPYGGAAASGMVSGNRCWSDVSTQACLHRRGTPSGWRPGSAVLYRLSSWFVPATNGETSPTESLRCRLPPRVQKDRPYVPHIITPPWRGGPTQSLGYDEGEGLLQFPVFDKMKRLY